MSGGDCRQFMAAERVAYQNWRGEMERIENRNNILA
jgi:hypothetical protein